MFSNRLKSLPFLALLALLTSCAYGYAAEEGEVHVEQQPEANTKVVEFDESASTDQTADTPEPVVREPDAPSVTEPESPCGVSTFVIRRYTPGEVVEKTIDCVERTVINVKRMPMSDAQFDDARAAGLPEGSWYLLVDPKGLRANYLSNAELIRISKHFTVEYLQKERERDLLIYEFRDSIR